MKTILLTPTDVLFFRDGRPMIGSLSGHGAAWPLPSVTNAALHAALHRAQVQGKIRTEEGVAIAVHGHNHHGSNEHVSKTRHFGSLVSAGPFPVLQSGDWLFPRPLDAGQSDATDTTLLPLDLSTPTWGQNTSLPCPLAYAVANRQKPSKQSPASWWNRAAWDLYLDPAREALNPEFHNDDSYADAEHRYGIRINSNTGTHDGKSFHSAHYLRLKNDCRLGVVAEAWDKIDNDPSNNQDLISSIFPESNAMIPFILGGQQRVCSVEREHTTPQPLPLGLQTGFNRHAVGGETKWLVKWILITPAIFPAILANANSDINAHSGGWLPNWIHLSWDEENHKALKSPMNGNVLLKVGNITRRVSENRAAWRERCRHADAIPAKLVAAIIGKSIPVTGYAMPHESAGREQGEAKPTHLAVPAGSVYYFTCDSENAAQSLASALNWHGNDNMPAKIMNRRSTLMGEKGFGLGVCGTWQFHDGKIPT